MSGFKGTKGPVKVEQARTILHVTGDSPICEISISANHVHEDYRGCKADYVERQRATPTSSPNPSTSCTRPGCGRGSWCKKCNNWRRTPSGIGSCGDT